MILMQRHRILPFYCYALILLVFYLRQRQIQADHPNDPAEVDTSSQNTHRHHSPLNHSRLQTHSHNHSHGMTHLRGHYSKRAPKIAFLFLVRLNLPLIEIWEEFFSFHANPGHFTIYVHPSTPYSFPKGSVFYNRTIPSHGSGWGSMTQVQAIRSLFRFALRDDPANEFFPVLSESCIPLYAFRKMYRILVNAPKRKSIINACPFTFEGAMEITRWKSSLDASKNMKKEFWRKSATWVMLIRSHAEIFAKSATEDEYWRQVPCVDEHFLPSILAMHQVDNDTTCSDGFTHVFWRSLIDSHPWTYSNDQINEELWHHLRYGKDLDFHEHPENRRIDFNQLCSGYAGICHFAARKFGFLSKFHLLSQLPHILLDDRDDIFFNPLPPPPLNASEDISFLHFPPLRYPGYDFLGKLGKNLRRKSLSLSEEIYYLDHVHLRVFPNLETVKFFFRLPLNGSQQEDEAFLASLPVITEEELKTHPVTAFSHFFPIKQHLLVKRKKAQQVFFIEGYEKRGLLDWDTLVSLDKGTDILTLSDIQFEEIPVGKPYPSVKEKTRQV